MNYDLKPYPEYKDSNLPWLGEVPRHWSQLPGRACYLEKKLPNTGMQDATVLSLSYGKIVIKPVEKLHGLVPASFETYQVIDPGDIIIRPTDLQNDWNSLRFGLSRHRGIITSAYMCLNIKGVMTREYGHLLLHAYDLKKVFYGLGSGLRQNLGWRDFKYLPCLVPPLPEQSAIVKFIDRHGQLVRRFIHTRRRLIELLNEQKQAIIHQAVTRGLAPNVRLKPSGIDWLDDVPEHWKIIPLKRIAWFKGGAGFPISEQGRQGLDIPFLKVSDMSSSGNETAMRRSENSISFTTASVLCATVFPAGAIVFPKVGGAMLTNKRRILEQPSCIDNNMMGCVVQHAERDYVLLLLHQIDLGLMSKPGPVPAVSEGEVREIRVALPPVEEQMSIVLHVKKESVALDTTITHIGRKIDLLLEYHTRLMADVVTGKLDVRGIEFPALDEADAVEDREIGEDAEAEEIDDSNEGADGDEQ